MEEQLVINAKKVSPSVSILMTVNNEYPHYKTEEARLKALVKQAKERLAEGLSPEMFTAMEEKLQRLISSIDFSHLQKAIAIYASPFLEKVIHLDLPVTDKLIIGRNFQVRDLLYALSRNIDVMVITLSKKRVRVLKGDTHQLEEIRSIDMPFGVEDTGGEGHSRTEMFSSFGSQKNVADKDNFKEEQLKKYLKEADNELKANLPHNGRVIVCGPEKELGMFKKLTGNSRNIIGYITGNFDRANNHELIEKINPVLEENKQNEARAALLKLEEAVGKKLFASGIREVWRTAMEQRGRILLVEKGYSCSGRLGPDKFTFIPMGEEEENGIRQIQDAVDDIMETVLKYNGEIIFVDNGMLYDHDRIALITRY